MAGRAVVVGTLALALGAGAIASAAVIEGTGDRDRLRGTGGSDELIGKRGRDKLRGRGGGDLLRAGPGADLLSGGKGRDVLKGGRGRDSFGMRRSGAPIPSPGNDVVRARDGRIDQINCGGGNNDLAVVDEVEDGVFDCERVREPAP